MILFVDELEQEAIRYNPENRCYLCKHYLFGKLLEFARDHGVTQVLDGTNEDDLHVYRPGRKALREYGVISPLAACHVTKTEVKALAAKYGVSVAHRPSTPCMATRLPYGAEINYDVLDRIADGEAWLHTRSYGRRDTASTRQTPWRCRCPAPPGWPCWSPGR